MNNITLTNGNIEINGEPISFKFDIAEYIDFGNTTVVRLKVPIDIIFNENVFGLNDKGKIIWQIERKELMHDNSPYTNITKLDEDKLRLNNWDGTVLFVNPNNGKILNEEWIK